MSADVLVTCFGELAVGGKVYRFGEQQPNRHAIAATEVTDRRFTVAATTNALLWSNTIDSPATFALLVIETDKAIMVELVTDEDDAGGSVPLGLRHELREPHHPVHGDARYHRHDPLPQQRRHRCSGQNSPRRLSRAIVDGIAKHRPGRLR